MKKSTGILILLVAFLALPFAIFYSHSAYTKYMDSRHRVYGEDNDCILWNDGRDYKCWQSDEYDQEVLDELMDFLENETVPGIVGRVESAADEFDEALENPEEWLHEAIRK